MALDDFAQMYVDKINTLTAEHNSKHERLSALTGEASALFDAMRNDTSDPKVVAFNDRLAKLQEQITAAENDLDKYLTPKVDAVKANSAAEVETLNTEVDALRKSIGAATTAVKDLYGDEAVSLLADVTGKRKPRTGSADGATPQRRIKGFAVDVDGTRAEIDTANGKSSNLAVAARVIGVDTKTVQDGFIAAQGTDDSSKYSDTVTFTVNDKDGKSHTVHCYRSAKTEAQIPSAAEVAAKSAE